MRSLVEVAREQGGRLSVVQGAEGLGLRAEGLRGGEQTALFTGAPHGPLRHVPAALLRALAHGDGWTLALEGDRLTLAGELRGTAVNATGDAPGWGSADAGGAAALPLHGALMDLAEHAAALPRSRRGAPGLPAGVVVARKDGVLSALATEGYAAVHLAAADPGDDFGVVVPCRVFSALRHVRGSWALGLDAGEVTVARGPLTVRVESAPDLRVGNDPTWAAVSSPGDAAETLPPVHDTAALALRRTMDAVGNPTVARVHGPRIAQLTGVHHGVQVTVSMARA